LHKNKYNKKCGNQKTVATITIILIYEKIHKRSKSSGLETAYFLLLLKMLIMVAIAPIIVNNPTIIENIGICPP